MNKLFASQKIEDYFSQYERRLLNEIDGYTEHYLGILNVDEAVEKLFTMFKVSVPKIDTSKTKTTIIKEQISGHQFPPGTPFQMGKLYDIEIAYYRIPYEGTKELFFCTPNVMQGIVTNTSSVETNDIIIQLTNWGKISGNDEAIEKIKEELIKIIETINSNLGHLTTDFNQQIASLKPKITSYLKKKTEQVKLRNNSADKLNPFK